MYQLEDRILFDGAAVVDVAAAVQAAAAQEADADAQQQNQSGDQQNASGARPDQGTAQPGGADGDGGDALQDLLGDRDLNDVLADALPDWQGEGSNNVLVVSKDLWNTAGLLDGVKEGTIIIQFDPKSTTGAELLAMIKDALKGGQADNIGFLTEGAKDGQFAVIADGTTSLGSIGDRAQQDFWSGLGKLVDADGRIDLFSSKLAGCANGRELVDRISGLSGRDVNASTDTTGDVDAGGDWDLEYSTGDKSASDLIADYFDTTALDAYNHKLSGATEIAFINPTVLGQEQILAGLGENVTVVYLPRENAFDFMTSYLENSSDVDAIHIFTHGEEGQFILGWTDGVDSDFVESHREEFAKWGEAMSENGDILIYGCNVAGDESGTALVDLLAEATGRDVAASANRVGYGGDWLMEYSAGKIEIGGYIFNNYFYSLEQFTVKNNFDDVVSSPESINRNDLSLREAIYLAQDGDLIVFANEETLGKSVRSSIYKDLGLFKILLQDTLVIDKNITIDGTVQMAGSPTRYKQMTLDATQATKVVLDYGNRLVDDTDARNGIQLAQQLMFARLDGDRIVVIIDGKEVSEDVLKYSFVDENNCWLKDVILNSAVTLQENFEVKHDIHLAQIANIAAGSDFAGHDVVTKDGTVLNFQWELSVALELKGQTILSGDPTWNSGTGGGRIYGTVLGKGSVLGEGSLAGKNTALGGAIIILEDGTSQAWNGRLVGKGEQVVLNQDMLFGEGTILGDGSKIKTTAKDNNLVFGVGTVFGAGTRLVTNSVGSLASDMKIAGGFTLNAGTILASGSVLPKETQLFLVGDKNYSVGTTDAKYIYAGSYVNQPAGTVKSGTLMLGDLTMQLRAISVDVMATNITGAEISNDTSSNTSVTSQTTGNSGNLPAGSTTTPFDPVVTTTTTTTTDDFSNTTITTVTTTVEKTVITVVTAATEDSPSTVTVTETIQTTVNTKVTQNGLIGVSLKNLKVTNGNAQVRPAVVGGFAGDIQAEGMAGGVYITGQSKVTMEDVFVHHNTADKDGGGIWNAGVLTLAGTSKLGQPSVYINWQAGINNNAAGVNSGSSVGNGGGLYNSGVLTGNGGEFSSTDDVASKGITISGNTTYGNGGGVYSATGQLSFTKAVISGNHAYLNLHSNLGGNGGGLYIDAKGSQPDTIRFFGCTISDNEAALNGGGLYFTRGNMVSGDSLLLEWSHVDDNTAGLSGGGLYVTASTGTISIYTILKANSGVNIQGTFIGNQAGVNGGAIAVVDNQGKVTVDFIKITGNSAKEKGGALYIENSQDVILRDVEMVANAAGSLASAGKGGAIYYTCAAGQYSLTISSSNLSKNTVQNGSGDFGQGGAIFLDNGTLKIDNSTLAFNGTFKIAGSAAEYTQGGAIYMRGGSLTINFSTLAYNRGQGAALFVAGDDASVANVTITNSIIFNSTTISELGPDGSSSITADPMVYHTAFSQIFLASPNAAGTGRLINMNFSTSTNIYSHYHRDVKYWQMSRRADGRSDNSLTISSTPMSNGSGWLGGNKVIAVSDAEAIAIIRNLYLDVELAYHANYRTQALSIVSQDSWAYSKISASGVKYDQRGNLRVDAKAWTWDDAKYQWVQGQKTKASVGAFEAIFYLEVNSKGDDSKIMYTYDQNGRYLDAAYGESGLTLREATYWVDTREGLLRVAKHALVNAMLYISSGPSWQLEAQRYVDSANKLFVNYNRFYTGIRLFTGGSLWLEPSGTDVAGATLATDMFAGIKLNKDGIAQEFFDAVLNNTLMTSQWYHVVNQKGSQNSPAAFGYVIDYTGQVVTVKGVPQRISTTGSVNFDKVIFAAGQNNTINLTHGEIYTSRTWLLDDARKDFVVGDLYGRTYRGQDAADRIIVKGDGATRIFTFGERQLVVLNNLTLTNGKSFAHAGYNGEADGWNGGGIWNAGILTMNNMRLTGNIAENYLPKDVNSGHGGGLYNTYSGRVYLYDTTIDNNISRASSTKEKFATFAACGAGIWNSGYLVVERSNISNNSAYWTSAVEGSGGIQGGGVYNDSLGTVLIANSTISMNSTDTRVASNGVNGAGGAIFNLGTLYSYGNTIYRNTMAYKGTPGYILAGFYNGSGSSLYLANTILAENIATFESTIPVVVRRDLYVANASVVQLGDYDGKFNIIGSYNNGANGGYEWENQWNIVGNQYQNAGKLDPINSKYGRVDNLNLTANMDYFGGKTQSYRVLGSSVALSTAKEQLSWFNFTEKYQDSLYDLGFRSIKADQRGADRTLDDNGNLVLKTNVGSYETISLLVVGSGKDSLNHRTNFDFSTNMPLWEAADLTLREALYLADDGTSVVFKSGWLVNGTKRADGSVVTNELDSAGRLIITLAGQLNITRDIELNGNFLPVLAAGESQAVPGVVTLKMSSGVNNRIFYVKSDIAGRTGAVAFYNLNLEGGYASSFGTAAASSGGAIFAISNLTLENVVISGARAGNGGMGGGIYLEGGVLELKDVLVKNCSALYGGGIYVKGSDLNKTLLVASNVSLLGNIARSSNGLAGAGGGLYLESGNALLEYVTIGNNKSGAEGGGIYMKSGSLTLINSTVANNSAGAFGGGIYYSSAAPDSLTLNFVTVANNQSGWSIGGSAVAGIWNGGGIYMADGGLAKFSNSIIAQNFRGKASLSGGIHDDVYVLYDASWTNGTQQNNLFGQVYSSRHAELGSAQDLRSNYYLSLLSADWLRFSGLVDGYDQLLDTQLRDNGGKQMTVFVAAGKNGNTYFQRALAGDIVFDQTQLEYFDGNNGTTVRQTVGAFEKQARTLYYVQGAIKGDALTQSVWISANGIVSFERDGVLSAADAQFVFENNRDVIPRVDKAWNQLVTKSISTSNGGVIYYSGYYSDEGASDPDSIHFGKLGKDDYTLSYFQDVDNAAAINAAGVFQLINTTTGNGTLVGNWTLFQKDLSMKGTAERSMIVVGSSDMSSSASGYFKVAEDIVLGGWVRLLNNGTLELETTKYDKLGLKLDALNTTVKYTSVKATQSVIVDDYTGKHINYNELVLTTGGSGKASTKTYAGTEQLTVNDLVIGGQVMFKVNAVPNQKGGDLVIINSVSGVDNDGNRFGSVYTAGSLYLGSSLNTDPVRVQNVQLDVAANQELRLLGDVTLGGNATLGSGKTTISYSMGDKQTLEVNGTGNQILTNVMPALINTYIIVKAGAELSFNFGSANMPLDESIFRVITLENGSRLEFRTTGKVDVSIFDKDATLANLLDGTLALYGTFTVDDAFLNSFSQDLALELGGKLTLATSEINWKDNFTLNGAITMGKIYGDTISIKSTGKVVLGGSLDVTGGYVSGNVIFNGGGKNLLVDAGTNAYVGGLTGFKDVTVNGAGGIALGGSITATGNITFGNRVEILDGIFDAKGKAQTLAVTAGGSITTPGFFTAAWDEATDGLDSRIFGELKLAASTAKNTASSLGVIDMVSAVNFDRGMLFQATSITAGALTSRATEVQVSGNVTVKSRVLNTGGAFELDGSAKGTMSVLSGTFRVDGELMIDGGTLDNAGTLVVGSLTVASRVDAGSVSLNGETIPYFFLNYASVLNRGTMTVDTAVKLEDGIYTVLDPITSENIVVYRLGSSLVNQKTFTAANVTLEGISSLENKSGTMNVSGAFSIGFGTLTNRATLVVGEVTQDGSGATQGATIVNYANMTVNGGIVLDGDLFANTLNVMGGTLTAASIDISGSMLNKGTVKAGEITIRGGVLENRGTMKESNLSTAKNPVWISTINLFDDASLDNYGTLTVESILSHADGGVDSVSNINNYSGSLTAMTIQVTGKVYNKGSMLIGEKLTIGDAMDNGLLLAVGSLENRGTINGVQIAKEDNGSTITDAYKSLAKISITGTGALDNFGTINAGALSLQDGGLYNNGTLTLAPVYTLVTDKDTKVKSLQIMSDRDGSLVISGKGSINNTGRLVTGSIDLSNGGTGSGDLVNNGTVTVSATFVKWSSVDPVSGKTVNKIEKLSEGDVELNGSFINNAGKSFSATSLAVNGIFSNGLYLSGGSIVNKGTLNIQAVYATVNNGGVVEAITAGNGKIAVYDRIDNLGGSLTGGSIFTQIGDVNNQAALTLNSVYVLVSSPAGDGSMNMIQLSDGSLTIGDASLSPTDQAKIYGSLINGKGKSVRVGSIQINTVGQLQDDGSYTGALLNDGTITVEAKGVIHVGEVEGSLKGQVGETLSTGHIQVGSGSGVGMILNGATGTINSASLTLATRGDLTNHGSINVKGAYGIVQELDRGSGKLVPTLVIWGGTANGSITLEGGDLINNKTITAGSLSLANDNQEANDVINYGTITLNALMVRTGTENNLVSSGNLTLAGTGSLTNGRIEATANKVTNGTVRLNGVFVDADAETGRLDIGGSLTNVAGSVTANRIDVDGNVVNGGAYINTKGVNVLTNGTLTVNTVAGENGSGQLNVGGSLENLAGSVVVNANAKVADSGSANIGGDLANNGTVTIGGALNVAGALSNNMQRTLTVAGTVFTVGGDVENNGTINAAKAEIKITGGSLTNKGKLNATELSVANGISNNGAITLTGDLEVSLGSLENKIGSSITAGGIQVSGSLINSGTVTGKGDMSIGSMLNNSGTMTLSGSLTAQAIYNNPGSRITAKNISVTLNLNNTGTINASGDLQVDGALNNNGTLTVAGSLTAQVLANGDKGALTVNGTVVKVLQDFTNNGVFNATKADVTVDGNLSNSGTMNVKSLKVDGEAQNRKSLTVAGDFSAAKLESTNATCVFAANNVTVDTDMNMAGTATVRGDLRIGGSLSSYAALTVSGGVFAVDGTAMLSGVTSATKALMTIGGTLTNHGTLTTANLTMLNGSEVHNESGVMTVNSIFSQGSGKLYNNGKVTTNTLKYSGSTDYQEHYEGNVPVYKTLEHVDAGGAAFSALAGRSATFNADFDDEAGQALEAFLAI